MNDPAPFRIVVAGSAQRSLRRLPTKVATAIVEFITGPLADNPHRLSKPLANEFAALRTARRGDYRVLLTIDDDQRTVVIAYIEHRADAYRPR